LRKRNGLAGPSGDSNAVADARNLASDADFLVIAGGGDQEGGSIAVDPPWTVRYNFFIPILRRVGTWN